MSAADSSYQPAPERTDQQLVAAIRRGEDRAFEELYGRYRRRIGAYVLGMVGDHGRAEDVAQEIFISALRRLRSTDWPIAFKPWIYQIAKNACIDELRRARRVQEVPLEPDPEAEQRRPALHSLAPAPEVAVEGKQRLDDLRGAFRGLSERHHRVIVLRELEGLSYNEIGERMGVSKPVVESMLFRARRRLGEEYDELASGRRCAQIQAVVAADCERSVRGLGMRERRQLTRHLSHCLPCRRQARLAGLDDSYFHTPGLVGKIAALLPIPWIRMRLSRTERGALTVPGSQQLAASQSLQAVTRFADPTAPMFGLGRGAAAAAAVVVAGVGGGLATGVVGHSSAGPGHGSGGGPGGRLARLAPAGAVVGHGGSPSGAGGRSGARIVATRVPSASARASSTRPGGAPAAGLARSGSSSTGSGPGGGGSSRILAGLSLGLGLSGTGSGAVGRAGLKLPGIGVPGLAPGSAPSVRVPRITLLGVPSLPGVSQLPGVLSIPGKLPLPGLPRLPGVPQLPGTPQLPPIPQLPQIQLPGIQLPRTPLSPAADARR